MFWMICFLPLLLVLYSTQLFASKIMYALLAKRCSIMAIKSEDNRRAAMSHQMKRRTSDAFLTDYENSCSRVGASK
jgi:hypothetical protein